jgi:hypothetical protein
VVALLVLADARPRLAYLLGKFGLAKAGSLARTNQLFCETHERNCSTMSNRESRGLFDTRLQISNHDGRMPRGTSSRYVVDDNWRKRVEEALTEKNWSRADLARESSRFGKKVGRSTITDLLNGNQNHCVSLPQIHKALGWDPPLPPILSNDASELFAIWDRLSTFERGRLLERARAIFEQQQVARSPSRKP